MSIKEASFRVSTYNMGKGISDYRRLSAYQNKQLLQAQTLTNSPAPLSKDKVKGGKSEYTAMHQNCKKAEQLAAQVLTPQADAFCLQEVTKSPKRVNDINGNPTLMYEDRPLISFLKDKSYTIVYADANETGCAIALNNTRFEVIDDKQSINIELKGIEKPFHKNAAIVVARDRFTNETVIFVSAHAPGFDLTNPNITSSNTENGDVYCKKILEKLNTLQKTYSCALRIIGGDLNANPEIWKPRFDTFTNAGFHLLRTGKTTNVNPVIPVGREQDAEIIRENQEREVDFMFFSPSDPQKNAAKIHKESPLTWENNASDHLPLLATITTKMPSVKKQGQQRPQHTRALSSAIKKADHSQKSLPQTIPLSATPVQQQNPPSTNTLRAYNAMTGWRNDTLTAGNAVKARLAAGAVYALLTVVSTIECLLRSLWVAILKVAHWSKSADTQQLFLHTRLGPALNALGMTKRTCVASTKALWYNLSSTLVKLT